ncbi:hypothetical protein CLOSTASPAR_01738 [[Clostridium] asparagiforme DSM 15981]|uniref:Uncharacterized protein n=1 Tax=[Clostridium] asparagiforme DSM 15981 TaxID=518636 RepID=C0CXL4_9FIRM|nr:hypothetical protein CLOSTASPAR_01738 [[Clostridium] asparagiforme DSM 15981]
MSSARGRLSRSTEAASPGPTGRAALRSPAISTCLRTLPLIFLPGSPPLPLRSSRQYYPFTDHILISSIPQNSPFIQTTTIKKRPPPQPEDAV